MGKFWDTECFLLITFLRLLHSEYGRNIEVEKACLNSALPIGQLYFSLLWEFDFLLPGSHRGNCECLIYGEIKFSHWHTVHSGYSGHSIVEKKY